MNSKRSIGYDLAREPTYTMIMIAYFICIITIVGMIIAIYVMYLRGKKIEGKGSEYINRVDEIILTSLAPHPLVVASKSSVLNIS